MVRVGEREGVGRRERRRACSAWWKDPKIKEIKPERYRSQRSEMNKK